jgi:hypothetical protein
MGGQLAAGAALLLGALAFGLIALQLWLATKRVRLTEAAVSALDLAFVALSLVPRTPSAAWKPSTALLQFRGVR